MTPGLIPGYDPHATAAGAWFDPSSASLACEFFPRFLRHVEGDRAGTPFILEAWQQAIISNLFGWKKKDSRGRVVRRYREAFIYVPRKNGKTAISAGLCLFCLLCDGERGAQIYSAAAEREQAALLFRHAKGMVEQESRLSSRLRVYGSVGFRSIVKRDDEASSYKVLSADAETKHGASAHLVVIDELHAQPNRDLVDVLLTSTASEVRKQPLIVYITTADFNRPSICNEKHDYACKVRDGIIHDPSFLPVVYEADNSEDWTDPRVWERVNPNLGVSVSRDYLERECQRARETPAYENTFRRLHLNQKTETDVRAIPMEQWDACAAEPVSAADLEGQGCYGGLDLSTTTDLTAFVLVFPEDGGGYRVLPFFWLPAETARLRSRRDRVPYEDWARAGLVTLTEGNVIDYDVVRRDINRLNERFAIQAIARDRWNATQITTQLQGDGFAMTDFGQGFSSMTAPTKEVLKLVAEGKLYHGGHPVLRWMASNLSTEMDAAGNLKPSKKKSTERIDGVVSLIMAIGQAMVQPECRPSVEVW